MLRMDLSGPDIVVERQASKKCGLQPLQFLAAAGQDTWAMLAATMGLYSTCQGVG